MWLVRISLQHLERHILYLVGLSWLARLFSFSKKDKNRVTKESRLRQIINRYPCEDTVVIRGSGDYLQVCVRLSRFVRKEGICGIEFLGIYDHFMTNWYCNYPPMAWSGPHCIFIYLTWEMYCEHSKSDRDRDRWSLIPWSNSTFSGQPHRSIQHWQPEGLQVGDLHLQETFSETVTLHWFLSVWHSVCPNTSK